MVQHLLAFYVDPTVNDPLQETEPQIMDIRTTDYTGHRSGEPTTALISVVFPFYNEASSIDALCDRLVPILSKSGYRWEIFGVDDGSRDGGFDRLAMRAAIEPRIKIVRFARNFGKEAAILAGLRHAAGDAVILVDADLQHPPELIPKFLELWRSGAEIVQGVRDNRRDQSRLRRFLSFAFYRLFRSMAELDIPDGATDFCLLDRRAVDAIAALPEHGRFFKGLVRWVGFRNETVPFQPEDAGGKRSVWTIRRLLAFGIDGICSFSRLPLRIWTALGAVLVLLGTLHGVWLVLSWLSGFGPPSTMAVQLIVFTLFTGTNLVAIGTVGEYVGRVLAESRRRPVYIVAETVGLKPGEDRRPPAADRSQAPVASIT